MIRSIGTLSRLNSKGEPYEDQIITMAAMFLCLGCVSLFPVKASRL
jgi:hypothetical protein